MLPCCWGLDSALRVTVSKSTEAMTVTLDDKEDFANVTKKQKVLRRRGCRAIPGWALRAKQLPS